MPKARIKPQLFLTLSLAAGLLLTQTGPALADSPPSVTVAAPTHQQGDMGAAVGDVIDGNNTGEIKWTQSNKSGETITYYRQSGVSGAFGGNAWYGHTPPGSDLAIAFYTNSSVSIPSNVYHYLLYRAWVDKHHDVPPNDEAGVQATNGVILYSSEWSTNMQTLLDNRRSSKGYDICNFGGWCLYFFDLNQNIKGSPSPNLWDWGQPGARVEAFGLWVHENWATSFTPPVDRSGDSPNFFYIDYLYLTGDIVALNNQYTIKWQVNDPDGGEITSNLYYKESDELLLPSQSPVCNAATISNWTSIQADASRITLVSASGPYKVYLPIIIKTTPSSTFGSGEVGPYNQQYVWNMSSGFTDGKVYYVCIEVVDPQNNKGYAVSSAPVIKVPALTTFPPE